MSERPVPSSPNPSQSGGIERRASTRYPCNLVTSCQLIAAVEGDAWPIRVRNISVGGVSLVISRPVEPGTLLSVELRSTTRNFIRSVHVRVIYCIEHPSDDYILGGAFTQPLSDDELKAFL
jgi:hypothetical protein